MSESQRLDGDGWVRCAVGHRHWGRYGAAGLLLRSRSEDRGLLVLLQHRAAWTHHGDTWGLPGGAKTSWETPEQAAVRETTEEADIDLSHLQIEGVRPDDHGGWIYWTVIASRTDPGAVTPRNQESVSFQWVPIGAVDGLPLHPGFAVTWPTLNAIVSEPR